MTRKISKQSLRDWLAKLMTSRVVLAPKRVGEVYLFRPVTAVDDIAFDYDQSTVPPKELFFPRADTLFAVDRFGGKLELEPPAAEPFRLPGGFESWPRYHDAVLGYSLPYPPGWRAQKQADGSLTVEPSQAPGHTLTVRVHEGELRYDQYDPASLPSLMEGPGWGVFEQGLAFGSVEGSQHLAGYQVDRDRQPGEFSAAVLFSAHGRTYELTARHPTGFAVRQPILTAFTAIVEGFRLDAAPGPSPTPPVRQTLGPGPFLSQEEALACARERVGQGVELLSAQLVPEAESRRRASACSTYFGHPEGVWDLLVRYPLEGQVRTVRLFVNATTGEQLCGEEVAGGDAGEFAIYLVQGMTPAEIVGADPSTLQVEGEPVLASDDIIAYDGETHEMQLTAAAAERLGTLQVPTSGLPFVACVGGEPIYGGAFWTGFSSQSFDGIVIDVLAARIRGVVRIEIGYPGSQYFKGPDRRSDPRVLRALERAGKLGER